MEITDTDIEIMNRDKYEIALKISAHRRDKINDLKHKLGIAIKEIKLLKQENKRLNTKLAKYERQEQSHG